MGLGLDADILCVDDNSPDGTGDLLDRLAEAHSNVMVLHRPRKMGIGSAHLDGIRWAYDHHYATLVTMDCDFSHQPEHIRDLLNESVRYEVVVGSRYLSKHSLRGWSLFRKSLTLLGHSLTRFLLRMKYDATGGFRAYRLDTIPREVFDLVQSKGYSFLFESLYILHANRFRIREVPIELPARTYGHSKMRMKDAFDSLSRLWKVFATATFNPSRYRVHTPAYAAKGTSSMSDGDAWDEYWMKPKSSAALIGGTHLRANSQLLPQLLDQEESQRSGRRALCSWLIDIARGVRWWRGGHRHPRRTIGHRAGSIRPRAKNL